MDEKQKEMNPHHDLDETSSSVDAAVSADVTTPSTHDAVNTGETTHDEEHAESGMVPMVVGAVILALVAIAAVWFFTSNDQAADDLGAQIGGDISQDTDGDPDDVVATVNGVDLTRAEYNRIRQQVLQNAQQMGMDINDPETTSQIDAQATDTLVNTELIRQAAMAAGSTASQEEIEARFAEIVAQVGGEEALADSLQQLGLTEESLRADVEQELIIQQFLESAIDTDGLTASEEEIDELYEASGGAEAGLPPIDEVRPQIEQQILANKENELINELVESLRADAEIDVQI